MFSRSRGLLKLSLPLAEVLSISSFIVIVCDKKKFKCMDENFIRSAFVIFYF
jgi:hypothetical protein